MSQDRIYAKLYHHSDFYHRSEIQYDQFNRTTGEYARSERWSSEFDRFSLAVLMVNQEIWNHEIGFSFSRSNQPITHESWVPEASDNDKKYFSLQYEGSKRLYDKGRLQLLGGIGATVYHANAELTPGEANTPSFTVTENFSGASLHIIPRAMYAFNAKLGLDVNAKIGLFDQHHARARIHNPQLTARQRMLADAIRTNLFPSSFILRLGLTYVIR